MKRKRTVKRPPAAEGPDMGVLTALVYEDLVEVEALAVTADEAVSNLPPKPRGKYGRTLARLREAQADGEAPARRRGS